MKARFIFFLVGVALSGCSMGSAINIIAFEEHQLSKIKTDQRFYLISFSSDGNENEDNKEYSEIISALLRNNKILITSCKYTPPAGAETMVVPAIIPLIAAGASVAFNELSFAVKSYIENKKKEFESTYSSKVNLDKFPLSEKNYAKCLLLRRYIKEIDNRGKELDRVAMDIVFTISKFGVNGATFKPIYLELKRAAASTGKDSGAINIKTTIAITSVQSIDGQISTYPVTEQSFLFRNVMLPNCEDLPYAKNECIDAPAQKYDINKIQPSSVFGIPGSPRNAPATILVSVTETGSGADDFANALQTFDANQKAIAAGLDGFLKESLKTDTDD